MKEKSVEPLIAAASALELAARRALGRESQILILAADSLKAMRAQASPTSVRVSPRTLSGPRVDLSAPGQSGLATTAFWPQDNIEATRFPILCGVLQGEATLPAADYSLHIPSEHLVFIPAGVPHPNGSQPHLSEESENGFCDLFWLYRWEGGLICHICHSRENMHSNFHANENCFLIGEQSMRYFDLLSDTLTPLNPDEILLMAPSNSVAAPYLLPALLAIIARELRAGRFIQPGVLPTDADSAINKASSAPDAQNQSAKWKENFGAIMQAQNYIAFHLDQPLSIDDVAQMTCMSRAQFTQLFRRATGKSFVQYLTFVRLERAKTFLHETDWSVEIIARAVGWRGAHLWKMFARELGTTPGEFRRLGKETPKDFPVRVEKSNRR